MNGVITVDRIKYRANINIDAEINGLNGFFTPVVHKIINSPSLTRLTMKMINEIKNDKGINLAQFQKDLKCNI